MLKEQFFTLSKSYTNNERLIKDCWLEIENNYSSRGRHYHNLQHLETLLSELTACKQRIVNWSAVLFALYYHDIVYNPRKKDNEEQSALVASKRLGLIGTDKHLTEAVTVIILATKTHHISDNEDINLFTDADLSILGKSPETYLAYYKQVRKEYRFYPDFLYKPGRKKVLEHFLAMRKIYKTVFFRDKYEETARLNMKNELSLF